MTCHWRSSISLRSRGSWMERRLHAFYLHKHSIGSFSCIFYKLVLFITIQKLNSPINWVKFHPLKHLSPHTARGYHLRGSIIRHLVAGRQEGFEPKKKGAYHSWTSLVCWSSHPTIRFVLCVLLCVLIIIFLPKKTIPNIHPWNQVAHTGQTRSVLPSTSFSSPTLQEREGSLPLSLSASRVLLVFFILFHVLILFYLFALYVLSFNFYRLVNKLLKIVTIYFAWRVFMNLCFWHEVLIH